jgi:hypothetical protein
LPLQGNLEASGMIDLVDASARNQSYTSPEKRLFIGVITNAILDAARPAAASDLKSVAKDKEEAIRWFDEASLDFVAVCDLADLDPVTVRTAALAYIKVSQSRHPMGVTINDVAKHLGVSRVTVDRVIAGHPSVLPSTRYRVNTALKELGYTSTGSTRRLQHAA